MFNSYSLQRLYHFVYWGFPLSLCFMPSSSRLTAELTELLPFHIKTVGQNKRVDQCYLKAVIHFSKME